MSRGAAEDIEGLLFVGPAGRILDEGHPSSILRARSDDERAAAMEQFVSDLASVGRWTAAHRR